MLINPEDAQDSSDQQPSRTRRDASRYASNVGLILIGISLNLLLFSSIPLQLLRKEWQLQFLGGVLNAGLFCLLGALFIALAPVFASQASTQISKRASLVRRICAWVAMAYLLIIPLQWYLGIDVLNQAHQRNKESLRELTKIIYRVKNSASEAELRDALSVFPDASDLPSKFDEPFEAVKRRFVANAESNLRVRQNGIQGEANQRWQDFLVQVIRNTVQSLLLAMGFAAIAKQSRDYPRSMLLNRLFPFL